MPRICAALCLAGAVLLLAAHVGAQGEEQLDAQVGWLSVAVVGSLLAASGQVGLLIVGRQRIAEVRHRVLRMAAHRSTSSAVGPQVELGAISVAGGTRFHRPTCLLVAGKAPRPLARTHRLHPCEVCQP